MCQWACRRGDPQAIKHAEKLLNYQRAVRGDWPTSRGRTRNVAYWGQFGNYPNVCRCRLLDPKQTLRSLKNLQPSPLSYIPWRKLCHTTTGTPRSGGRAEPCPRAQRAHCLRSCMVRFWPIVLQNSFDAAGPNFLKAVVRSYENHVGVTSSVRFSISSFRRPFKRHRIAK